MSLAFRNTLLHDYSILDAMDASGKERIPPCSLQQQPPPAAHVGTQQGKTYTAYFLHQ